MDKRGIQRTGPKDKEIDDNAKDLAPKRWHIQTTCQEKKDEEDSIALRVV